MLVSPDTTRKTVNAIPLRKQIYLSSQCADTIRYGLHVLCQLMLGTVRRPMAALPHHYESYGENPLSREKTHCDRNGYNAAYIQKVDNRLTDE
jgi:hypothetical protein